MKTLDNLVANPNPPESSPIDNLSSTEKNQAESFYGVMLKKGFDAKQTSNIIGYMAVIAGEHGMMVKVN